MSLSQTNKMTRGSGPSNRFASSRTKLRFKPPADIISFNFIRGSVAVLCSTTLSSPHSRTGHRNARVIPVLSHSNNRFYYLFECYSHCNCFFKLILILRNYPRKPTEVTATNDPDDNYSCRTPNEYIRLTETPY